MSYLFLVINDYLFLLFKNEINSEHQKNKSNKMIPSKSLIFKGHCWENSEDNECDYFLYYFQLKKRKRTSIFAETNSVCRNLKNVLKKCYSPTYKDDSYNGQGFEPFKFA